MRCPFCGYHDSQVVDSRPAEDYVSIRRRRECLSCKKRFTTFEVMESLPVVVIKRDGSRQSFDRIATEIEQTLQNEMNREVSSTKIGEMVMDNLKGVDEVAYVRFASVYRQFKDISTFMAELSKLLEEK